MTDDLPNPKRIALYVRVSTEGQKTDAQHRAIAGWLRQHGAVPTECRWFSDEGFSGANMARPQLRRMLAAASAGEVDMIVVYALDRLARSAIGGMVVLHEILSRGVRFVSVKQQLDYSGAVGQLIASVLFHVGQIERAMILERQRAGVAAAREKVAQARQMRREGRSPEAIAVRLHCSRDHVMKMLARPDGKLWWGGRRRGIKKGTEPERVKELLDKGLPLDDIASILDVSISTVVRRLRVVRAKSDGNGER